MKTLSHEQKREIFGAKCVIKPYFLELFHKAKKENKKLTTEQFVKTVFFSNMEKYDSFRFASFKKSLDTLLEHEVETNHQSDWNHIRPARYWVYKIDESLRDFAMVEIEPFLTKQEAEAFKNGCFKATKFDGKKDFNWVMTSDYEEIKQVFRKAGKSMSDTESYLNINIY